MSTRQALWPSAFAILTLLVLGLLTGGTSAAPIGTDSKTYLPLIARMSPLLGPTETVGSHTLERAALVTAAYNVSLDPARYPRQLPYEVLNAIDRAMTVPSGRYFYVPIAYADDSPPIIGSFPTHVSEAEAYFFGRAQLGAHDCFIELDGIRYTLGPMYLSGPQTTDPLPDGGGTHILTLGAFLRPLPRGQHTVSVGSSFDGDAILPVFGGPVTYVATYIVTVQ